MSDDMDHNKALTNNLAFQPHNQWLMAARGGHAQPSKERQSNKENGDKDGCEASLMEILEKQIIPSLLKSTEHSPPFISTDGTRLSLPTTAEVTRFAEICISGDADLPDTFVQGLIAEGLGAEIIFLHLLTPAARHLGYLWDEDLCDFTQVTVGLMRMQQITLRLGSEFQEKRKSAMSGRRALFAPAPGSQHTFGVLMVSEFFRRAGWQVWMELATSEAQLRQAVQKDWFDIIGLSVGAEAQAEDLADIISQLRAASANPHAKVLIGGPLLISEPDLYRRVGADGAASDAESAIELARQLLATSHIASAEPATASVSPGDSQVLNPKEIMDRFRRFRMSRGITMKAAALQLSIHHSSLTKYEQLDRQPKPEILEKIVAWIESVQNQSSRMVKKR